MPLKDLVARAAYMRKWRQANRDKIRVHGRERQRLYRERNPGASRAYYLANKERLAPIRKAWRENNRERMRKLVFDWSKNNPERRQKQAHDLRRANLSRYAAYAAKRRAALRKAVPEWVNFEIIELIYAEAAHRKMTVDHIIPLQGANVCGLHVHDNMQLLSHSANSGKRNRFTL